MEQSQFAGLPASLSVRDVGAILWRRLWVVILVMSVALGTAHYVSKRTPPRWRATGQLLLIQRMAPTMVAQQSNYSAPIVESVETQVALLQTYAAAKRALDWMKSKDKNLGEDAPASPEDLQNALSVSESKDTNLINVSVEANSAHSAEELAKAVCDSFVDWKKEAGQQSVASSVITLENRVNRARAQMVDAERREMAFKQSHHMADVSSFQKASVDEYLNRNNEVATVKQDVISQEARLKALGKRLQDVNDSIKNAVALRDDTEVLRLQAQLNQMEIKRANDALIFTPDFPGPDSLPNQDARIKDMKALLEKAIQNTLDNKRPTLQSQGQLFEEYKQAQVTLVFGQAKLAAAVNLRDQAKRQLAGIPQDQMEYQRLARNAELSRSLHTSLQAALNAARIDQDMANGNVQVAQDAHAPEKPFRPDHLRDLVFGAAIGLFLSLVSVLLLEQSDRRVRTIESVRRLVPGPVVGVLPRLSGRQIRMLREDNPPPQAMEAYSLARANMALAARNSALSDLWNRQVILVTSAIPGEGKSVTAAALARSFARSGRSVILVDADLRRPAQNRIFGTDEPRGLADILAGEMTLDEALVASGIANLTILHSGSTPRNPTELISTPQMEETLAALRQEADIVLVDTPACSVVADALILAPHADCILHVIGAGLVDEETVRDTTTILSSADPKAMFFFINRASKERSHAYKYYYSYANRGAEKPANGNRPTSGGAPARARIASSRQEAEESHDDTPSKEG